MARTTPRVAFICGIGRAAALQILAIAHAIAAVCALHPIPLRSARLPLGVMQDILKWQMTASCSPFVC